MHVRECCSCCPIICIPYILSIDAPRKVWVNVSQEVMEGNSVVLHCDVDSNPMPQISWFFGDEQLMSETASNASLYLESLTAEQEGLYTCVGDNGYGTMNSSMYLAVRCESIHPSCYCTFPVFSYLTSLFLNLPQAHSLYFV